MCLFEYPLREALALSGVCLEAGNEFHHLLNQSSLTTLVVGSDVRLSGTCRIAGKAVPLNVVCMP